MEAAEIERVLDRARMHARRFDEDAERVALRGDSPMRLLELEGRPPPGPSPTTREVQVLQLVAEGLANREIGGSLYLSEETVKSHVRHLLAKLQARSRAHAVAVGFRRGLIG